MKKSWFVAVALFVSTLAFASASHGRSSMLQGVNDTCNTSYGCGLCHFDTKGGGPLTPEGEAYVSSGQNPCYFCPTSATCNGGCTDADGDGYFAQSGCGTSVDCDDTNAAVNPGATENCTDKLDNDCNGKVDCADGNCAAYPTCTTSPEICNDGIDNDGDRKVDCADRDCAKDPSCMMAPEGKGKTCNDGKDNDGDGLIDCADPGCAGNRACK